MAVLPLLAVAAPLTAWRRSAALRRRGNALLARVKRRRERGIDRITLELSVPSARWGEVVAAVSSVLAEAAASLGYTVGCIGIVAGEEPILVAIAPRRDPIAARARSVLASLVPHRYPQLWLTLPPGTYLAQVVEPSGVFEFDEERLLDQLRHGIVGPCVRFEVTSDSVSTRLDLVTYGSRRELRKLVTLARNVLSRLPDWRAAR
ncbi:MAG: hypothetical protein ACHQQS_03060 [Thermoanaerobaculales bacterium]